MITCAPVLIYLNRFNKDKEIYHKLSLIPISDRQKIEAFFRVLLFREGGAYVIFGEKPVAVSGFHSGYGDIKSLTLFRGRIFRHYWSIKKGLESWKKYSHLFPSKRFIIKEIPIDHDTTLIFLISKENVLKTVRHCYDDFKCVLGNMKPNSIVKKILREDKAFLNLIKHEAFLGILLGFGRNNAWLFHKRARTYYDPNEFTLIVNPKPEKGFISVEEERAYYSEKMKDFPPNSKRCIFNMLELPSFCADLDSEETRELLRNYQLQRDQIHALYSNGNFLEITLRTFTKK